MTYIANAWDRFVTAFMKPFVRMRENRLKLLHTIEMDKQSQQERHLEAILESQQELARSMHKTVEESTSVLKDWLEGFHKLPDTPGKAPAVNNDERMWRLEMEAIAGKHGINLSGAHSSDIEALIRQELSSL